MSNLIHFVNLLKKRQKKKEDPAGLCVYCLSRDITWQDSPQPLTFQTGGRAVEHRVKGESGEEVGEE